MYSLFPMEESVRHLYYNCPNMRKTLLASCRSQFLLDRLGKCLKLFVSTVGTSCHKFASQYGLDMFLYAKFGPKTTPNTGSGPVAYCLPVTLDRSPATTCFSGDHRGPCGVRSSQYGEMQQVKTTRTRDYTFTA